MNEIHESLTILRSIEQIPDAATAYVAQLPLRDGKAIVPIRVSIGDLVVERTADLTLTHVRAFPGYEIMDIHWGPHDGGPYPIFHGTLSAEATGSTFSRLDLDGKYETPLGIAGAMFDAVVGHRIAVSAARTMLAEIKRGFEAASKAKVLA